MGLGHEGKPPQRQVLFCVVFLFHPNFKPFSLLLSLCSILVLKGAFIFEASQESPRK